jgi:hypothetical protein
VVRITHEHWSIVCRNGSAWVLLRLIDQCKSVVSAKVGESAARA